MGVIPYPLVNGHRFDWSSCRITFDGIHSGGVKSISYKQTLTPGIVRGTYSQAMGRTRGQYECEGSLEMYKEDYQDLILRLSRAGTVGYMETTFGILVQASSGVLATVSDTLAGVRIASDEDSAEEGPDGLTVSCDLSIMYILKNGLSALSPDQLLR